MISENDVRLIRQELLALEEGRTGDAKLIRAYLAVERFLSLRDVRREEVSADWLQYWGVPGSVQRMIVLLDYGHEPIFRIPATLNSGRAVAPLGTMEVPFEVPPQLVGSVKTEDGPIVVEVPTPKRKSWVERFLYG